jgi:hypothetical protein
MAFGTTFTLDTVAQQNTTVAEIGEDAIWANLDAYFAAHNELFMMAAEMVAETTTDRMRRYGATADLVAQELGEFGQPSAQKLAPTGYNVGFPLRRYGYALQWTRFAFENMSAEEFSKAVNAITDADEQALYAAFRRAIFKPTNSTFADWQQKPTVDLPVKALLNADSDPIPTGPSGTAFDGATHTHYTGVTAANAPTQAEAIAFIENVVEHFNTGNVRVFINRAEEADVLAFADFKEYIDARLVNLTAGINATGTLDVRNLYDRAIGLLSGAEFHVKPWIPAGYWFATADGPEKPLVMRQPIPQSARNLRLVAQDENYPLRASEWEHRFGVSVWNRANGAVLDVATGSTTYTDPGL